MCVTRHFIMTILLHDALEAESLLATRIYYDMTIDCPTLILNPELTVFGNFPSWKIAMESIACNAWGAIPHGPQTPERVKVTVREVPVEEGFRDGKLFIFCNDIFTFLTPH